ncbi:MAG: tetratricopeptide repeat protein [Myxococcota bacterium]
MVALLFAGLGWLTPFSQPTYELSLVAGLVCPGVAAVATALDTRRQRGHGLATYGRAIATGMSVALAALGVALLHGVRSTMCDPIGGTVQFALGPGMGSVLGGVWGAAAAEVARRRDTARPRAWAVGLALLGPVGSMATGVALFYASPAVFAFDPFVGFFSGALYDTVLADDPLWRYRAGSVATLLAAAVAASHLERDAQGGRLRWVRRGRPGLVTFGVACALVRVGMVIGGAEFGFWQTAGTIERTLGGRRVEGRCIVVFDRSLDRDHIARFARDCDAHIERVSAWLQVEDPAPVTAYVFRTLADKQRLMGAARTSIAKPWRREIYLNDMAYPHTVVEHELVHALAADLGRGPFRIAGDLGGWLPNPGLIEGLAVAGAPRDEDLSADEWAAAMKDLRVLPTLESLFSLSFLTAASSTSYTAAGSFVGWVRERFGADVVGRWYGGEALPALTGASWAMLERDWHAHLDTIVRDEAAARTAQRRFDRPGVLGRRCPHVIDERLAAADAELGAGDITAARTAYTAVGRLDPDNERMRFGLAECAAREGDEDGARALFGAIVDDDRYVAYTHDRARDRMAALDLRHGRIDAAVAAYRDLEEHASDSGRQRTYDLLAHYADDPAGRPALLALLIGTGPKGPNEVEALDRIGRWRAAAPADGTPNYLFGRQHFNRGAYDLAVEAFDEAQRRGGLRPAVALEVDRLLVVAHCARGRRPAAETALARYMASPVSRPRRRDHLARLVSRCRG